MEKEMSQFNIRPLALFDDLEHELNGWLRIPSLRGQRYVSSNPDLTNAAISQWIPPVDIKTEKNQFLLKAEVPGIDPKNIHIQMEDGMLTITGEKVIENHQEGESYTCVERQSGKFYRRFALPDGAADQGIKATSRHGVLEITIPKTEKKQAKTISVEEAK